VRLEKFIATSGVASRRAVKRSIREGRVTVNGTTVFIPGHSIDVQTDTIVYEGELVEPLTHRIYLMLNKPVGYITTRHDERGRQTVMDLLTDLPTSIYPVGRLDLDTEGEIDENAAIENIRRYVSILPDYPMTFAVENARQSASLTLKLAVAGGAKLTYDETNTYRPDGTTLNTPGEFWKSVKMDDLTSVHFKQKTEEGVLSEVRDGYVDFRAIKQYLISGNYTGDLLLENTATKHSLIDAINSREYLLGC